MSATVAATAEAAEYRIEVLGSLGGSYGRAQDICGQTIVGYAMVAGGSEHAFVWTGTSLADLGTLGGNASRAYGVNGSGVVCGWAQDLSGATWPTLWRGGAAESLPTLGYSGGTVWAINDAGQAVGSSYSSISTYRAALWQGGAVTDLGTLGGTSSVAYGINSAGVIVGQSQTLGGTSWACLWDGGTSPVNLGGLTGCTGSAARGINDSGQIIFWNYGLNRASFWDGQTMVDLGTLGGEESWAYGLNNNGQVVGWADLSSGVYHAFVWDDLDGDGWRDADEMQDLGTLGGLFSSAYGIGDDGVIVGYAQDADYHWQAVRWVPVPEPATALLMAVSLAGMRPRRRR